MTAKFLIVFFLGFYVFVAISIIGFVCLFFFKRFYEFFIDTDRTFIESLERFWDKL